MARTKQKGRRGRGGQPNIASRESAAGPSKPVDVQSLLDKAHTLLAQSNFELAIKFLNRVVEVEPGNLEAREVLGIAELEGGDEDLGREHLLHLFPPHTPSQPTHPSPYLYLAQTAGEPHEALGYYSTAAAMIENALKGQSRAGGQGGEIGADGEEEDGVSETKAMGVRALVAMIEIWMSDLCMDPSAETNCDALITRAITLAPLDPEVQLTLASIRMSQSREAEAKEVVLGVYERIRDLEAFSPLLPPLPTRLSLARQLLEHNLHLPALDILQTAREEDSLEVESAYLEGWAFYLRAKYTEDNPTISSSAIEAGSDTTNANGSAITKDILPEEKIEEDEKTLEDLNPSECLSEAFRALIECAKLFEDQEYPDEGIGGHTGELLEELKERGVVPAFVEEDEGEGEGGGGWEDVDMA